MAMSTSEGSTMAAILNLSDINRNVSDGAEVWTANHVATAIVSEVIAIAGIIGNIVVVAVMLRPTFWKLNISIYLMALGFADGGALVFRFLSLLPITNDVHFLDSFWACRVVNWFRDSLHMVSSWLLVEVSIERAIVIAKSTKTNFQCTRRLPIGMTIGTVLLTFTIIGGYVIGEKSSTCTVQLQTEHSNLSIVIIGIAIHTAIPAFILIVTNIVICFQVYRHYKVYPWTHLRRSNSTSSDTSDNSNKVIWILIVNSCGFVLLTIPQVALFVYLSVTGSDRLRGPTRQTVELICRMLDTLNHSINPLLYTVSGSLYRGELTKLIHLEAIKRSALSLQVFMNRGFSPSEPQENPSGQ